MADAGNEADYDESSAELYDEVAQGIAAATSASGYASLVAEYGPLLAGPIDPSAAPYAAEGASLADAALAEIQSTDSAWLTQQTTTADADLSEENTDASAQAGLINSQAAADATLTVSSAQADYNGTLASIAAGPSAAAGPTLPAAPAPLTAASIGFASPSLPSQPTPTPGVPDAWFETLIGTNIESNPAAFHGLSPATVASDEPSINVQYGQVSEAVNLAAVETSIQAPITATNDYYYYNYAVTPTTNAAPTGMTYDAIAPPSGTTGSYDGNAWNPSSGDVSEAWFASAVQNVVSDATTSHAGGWAGIPGATPAVNLGTSNATLTTLLDDGKAASVVLAQAPAATAPLVRPAPIRPALPPSWSARGNSGGRGAPAPGSAGPTPGTGAGSSGFAETEEKIETLYPSVNEAMDSFNLDNFEREFIRKSVEADVREWADRQQKSNQELLQQTAGRVAKLGVPQATIDGIIAELKQGYLVAPGTNFDPIRNAQDKLWRAAAEAQAKAQQNPASETPAQGTLGRGGDGNKPPTNVAAGGGADDGPGRGIGGNGWRGDKNWRDAVAVVGRGGTIENIRGQVPTEQEAIDLIKAAGGTVNRIEEAICHQIRTNILILTIRLATASRARLESNDFSRGSTCHN